MGVGVDDEVGLALGEVEGTGEAVEVIEPGTGFPPPLPLVPPPPLATGIGVAVLRDKDGNGEEHAKAGIRSKDNRNHIRYFLFTDFPSFPLTAPLRLSS